MTQCGENVSKSLLFPLLSFVMVYSLIPSQCSVERPSARSPVMSARIPVWRAAACLLTTSVLAVGCQAEQDEPVAAVEAVDTGGAMSDVDERREEVITELAATYDMAVQFEGGYDPDRGLWFEPQAVTLRGVEQDPTSGMLRTADQGLFCEMRLTSGRPDTLVLDTVAGSVGTHLDGPTGVCGTGGPPLNLDYGSQLASGALCADIRLRSAFASTDMTDVYAMITDISSETNRAYTAQERNFLGLGNGASPPPGNNAPTDAFGGLFLHGDIPALDESIVQWIFKFDSQPFRFSGVVLASFQEQCNGVDDDCDGVIDEAAGCYPNGFECESDADCQSSDCDPSIRTCGGTILEEICDNGIDDNGDGDIDCLDRKCSGEPGCPDFGCANGNIGGALSVYQVGQSNFSVVSGTDAQTVENELSDFTLTAEQCGSLLTGADRAYLWQAPVAGSYTVTVSSTAFDAALVVVDADECPIDLDLTLGSGVATCSDSTVGVGTESTTLNVAAGDSFFFIVDSAIPSDNALGYGAFQLLIEKDEVCGDGWFDEYADLLGNTAEACDSGGVNASDCDLDCTAVECNDGILNAAAEGCEDGNDVAGDGCDATCVQETGWTCPAVIGQACTEVCGDGQIVGAEVCDDGDATGGNGCAGDCRAIEPGWDCAAPGVACTSICGDSLVVGDEGCDDGNTTDGDGCGAACVNVESGYRCPANGGACTNIDECAEDSDNCSANATCSDTPGSFTCACNSGYTGDGVTCDNIDECVAGTDNCDANATCGDTDGSFTCACNSGYSGDGVTCTDDNECDANPCSVNGTCTNLPGSFSCACDAGYQGNGFVCDDTDECAEGLDNCGTNALCTNLPSSFSCACAPGYTGDPIAGCTDINECLTNPCDINGSCANTDGGFDCTCDPGYDGDGLTCANVDECSEGIDNCGLNAGCIDRDPATDGVPFECACLPGFGGDPVAGCTDLNECTLGTDNCSDNAGCENTVGSFACTCLPGFVGDGVSCDDLNECATGADNCDSNATCQNTTGDFLCICNAGFQGTGDTCTDLNECTTGTDNCDTNAACTNIDAVANPGQFFDCTCDAGYSGDGVTCADDNECALGTDNCDVNGICTNTAGGFTCACAPGFVGDGQTCTDVNECATNNGGCAQTCTNNPGGFTCSCVPGYTLNADGLSCDNINECALNTDNCSVNAACTDTIGGFNCACNSGFTGDGVTCTDINECLSGNGGCSPDASCTNTPGSRTCTCNSGYTGNGVTCTDVNECLSNNGGCSANAACTNTPGGRSCACNTGYTGNGVTCTDVNECTLGTDNCSDNASCTNTVGGFACTCNSGFTGNGVTCTDVNECLSNPCATNASCSNTPGSYTCACLNGFGGNPNGAACTPVCGDGQVVGGEQCDYGQSGVAGPNAPACEASSCGYCTSTCTNATTGPTTASCTDSSDNDGDGFTNCSDANCAGVGSCPNWDCYSGSNVPGDRYLGTFEGQVSGSTSGLQNNFSFGGGPDVRYYWVAPRSGWFLFSTCNNASVLGSSNFDTEVGVQAGAAACGGNLTFSNDDVTDCTGLSSALAVNVTGGQNYSVVVDGYGASSVGNYTLAVDDLCASVTDQSMRGNICGTFQQCEGGTFTESCNCVSCNCNWWGNSCSTCCDTCTRPRRRYRTADSCGCGAFGWGAWQNYQSC